MSGALNSDWLNQCKSYLRRYPKLYNIVVWIVAPCYIPLATARSVRAQAANEKSVLNLGAGTIDYGSHILNMDIQELSNIDCVADAHKLPLSDASIDRIICLNTLEHVARPTEVIDEMYRVIKPGGTVTIVVPFLFGFHAAPCDFHRWTAVGLANDFEKFSDVQVSLCSGPTSSLLAILHEWLAILFCFNNEMLYRCLSLFFMVVLSPIKFLDLILARYSMSSVIGCTFRLEARKPAR